MLTNMRRSPRMASEDGDERVIASFGEHARLGQHEPSCNVIVAQSELVAQVEQLVMSKYVKIAEIQPLPEAAESPIVLFTPYNTAVYSVGDGVRTDQRTYLGCKPNYVYLENSIRHRKQVTGRVVSVNSGRRSLVVKPRWARLSGEHCWVRMVDDEGQPLVSLSIL